MGHLMVRLWILLLLAGALVTGFAAPPAIGMATGTGSFLTDNFPVQGNATVFDGTLLETFAAPSIVRLQGGPRMQLGSTSRGRVYSDRMVLEKGNGQVAGTSLYWIEARNLHIAPGSADSSATVAIRDQGKLTVAALSGSVRVTTGSGTLVAELARGTALEFDSQAAGASAPILVSGCLVSTGGVFLLKDDTTRVSFEVRGQDLAQYAGQRVSLTATVLKEARAGEATVQVIQTTQVKRLGGGCAAPPTSQKGGKGAGMTAGTKAVIAGVVVAAAVGGTTLGLTGNESQTPISR